MTGVLIDNVKILVNNNYRVTRVNYRKMKFLCNNYNWKEIKEINDVEKATETLIHNTCRIKEESNDIFNKKPKLKPRKEWVTQGIMKSCDYKNYLYKKWKKTVKSTSTSLKNKFQLYNIMLKKFLKTAKNEYFNKKANKFKNSK